MEKKYLISWSSKNDVEKSIYFPETEKDAEEYLANLISNNAKDVSFGNKYHMMLL